MSADPSPIDSRWWPDAVEASLDRDPARKAAWVSALQAAPSEQRPGFAYLITYLPLVDLQTLKPEDLASNVALAYQARGEALWGKSLPDEIFLDAVLPHASVTELRDSSRRAFRDRYFPLVKDCKKPGEAALLVNKSLFVDHKVTYNTKRLRTDQNSKESIAQGMATCTGLSIMLVEACRAVGVPARLAGIHSWPGRGGNHTWVEIWDNGWHFVGAAEPDSQGLDHAWFVGDASKAIKTQPKNAIFAVCYRETGVQFPLAWNPKAKINAENVTDRYKPDGVAEGFGSPRLMVETRLGGERVEAKVVAVNRKTGETALQGECLGPRADVNLHLSGPVRAGDSFYVVARFGAAIAAANVTVKDDTVVRLDLDVADSKTTPENLAQILDDRFSADPEKKVVAERILAEVAFKEADKALTWKAYRSAPIHAELRKEWEAKIVKTTNRTSPYLYRKVGEKPKNGWPLVIAMHGGGGAPQELNDSQWNKMFTSYYKDHPEVGGYIYLALRAPNNEWNGFYDDAIAPLVERLILQFVLFEDVDPNMVETLGASHGGYGAFVIGTKIPDRFAAVHASASAPTPGETQGENLMNTRFTFMIGENDTAYGRADRCKEFAKLFEGWKAKRGGYLGEFEWRPGVGHSVPDRDKVAEMIKAGPRNPWPKEVVWVESDDILKHCYWVEAIEPVDSGRIEASVKDNTVTLKTEKQAKLALWMDSPLVDLGKPVIVKNGDISLTVELKPTLGTYCLGLEGRGDPSLAAAVRIELP